MPKFGAIKKGVSVRRREDDKAGRINSVYLHEDGSVAINVVWNDRTSGSYDARDIVLADWASSSD